MTKSTEKFTDLALRIAQQRNIPVEKAEMLISKAAMLVNLAYALSDTQDSLLREADALLSICYKNATHDSRMRFRRIKNNVQSALYSISQEAKHWNTSEKGASEEQKKSDKDTQRFIEGLSDLFYDVVRMLFDRMAKKKDVIHLIHLIRSIPNHNHYFPKLDKGRYIVP